VLGGVAVLLAVLILPYFQKWLVQRSQLQEVQAEVVQARQDVAELQAQRRRWQDDDYVRAQARERLHFVLPGETGYVVVDAPPDEGGASGDPGRQAASVPVPDRAWFSDVWISARVAGAAGSTTP
jgi:hypothetical protein